MANHSKGMSIVPHLAAHKGVLAMIAAVGVLLAAGAAVERESGTKWLEGLCRASGAIRILSVMG